MAHTEHGTGLTRGGALDGLRFAAAAFITLYHFGAEEAPRVLAEVHPALGRGYLATDFFLILSGYILARTYGPKLLAGRMGAGAFLVRRIARIWPAHLVVLTGFALVVLASAALGLTFNNPQAFRWDGLLRQIVFAHAWGLGPEPGWNSATWTLSALVVCYAGFPGLWRALSAMRPSAALASGVALLLAADLLARGAGADLYTLAPGVGVLRGVPLFVLGAATARFGMARAPSPTLAWGLGLGGIAAFTISQGVPGWSFVSMLAIAAVILAAGTHAPRRPSVLVAEAAALSFALFITHNLVGLVWFRALKLAPVELPEAGAWVVWAAVFPACLLAALVFHHRIDLPIQVWLKIRLAGPMRPGATLARA